MILPMFLTAVAVAASAVDDFQDSVGDSGAGPDIVEVKTQPGRNGRGGVTVFIDNRGDLGAGEHVDFAAGERVSVLLDRDRSPATGCERIQGIGVDYRVDVFKGAIPSVMRSALVRCANGRFVRVPRPPTVDRVAWSQADLSSDGELFITLLFCHMGKPKAVRYLVGTAVGSQTAAVGAYADLAPGVAARTHRPRYGPYGCVFGPIVIPLKAQGQRGQEVRLRYRVVEGSFDQIHRIRVLRGKRALARLRGGCCLRGSPPAVTSVRWLVPRSIEPGRLRHCVSAHDAEILVFNRERCAPLVIR